jgi:predicted 2-oxoglutarate/Fe(II)-dependent dioxygenase YbiX
VGPIALPILPAQAEQLIATAERAPYGRGEKTLTDTSVRRTWQIAPDRVRIGGRHWPKTLDAIVARAAEGLGVPGTIEADFYKLLIYDEGGFFVPHRDTEKTKGMFATLILVPPSISEGGELIVRHKDRDVTLDLRCEEPSDIAFAAFYADCVHEVRPVTAGHRVALVYNLVRHGRGAPPAPPHYAAEEAAVTKLLGAWTDALRSPKGGEPQKVVYPLEYAYTPAELSFQALKGADAGVARVLAAAAPRVGCDVHLALITVEEDGSAEYSDWSRSRRGRSRYRDDEDEENDAFEVIEVTDRTVVASTWRRPDGEASPLTEIPVEDDELSPPGALEDLEPDEQHFHEATGNEGASFERTYRRAALVLWPQDRLFAIINQAGIEVTLPFLADLNRRWTEAGGDRESPLWHQAHELSGHMTRTWSTQDWHPTRDEDATTTGQLLDLLCRFGDLARLERFLALIANRGGFDRGDNKSIADGIRLLPPARAASMLERIIKGAAERTLAACGALLAALGTMDRKIVAPAARVLVDALPAASVRGAWDRGPGVESRFVTDLFTALARIDPVLGDEALTRMLAKPKVYDFDEVLVPAVGTLLGEDPRPAAIERLRLACLAHLEARIALPLAPPGDWGRPSKVGCACAHCAALSRFLADPATERWVLRANERDRQHVARTIGSAHCDVDMVTERRGSPYSLVCTKNQASYQRRKRQRGRDLAELKRLNGSIRRN